VDVWHVHVSASDLGDATDGLDSEERRRAEQFRFDRDRRLFVCARAAARSVLAERLGTAPSSLRFRTSGRGKPELDGPFRALGLEFNWAHSGDVVVVAVATGHPVGVDVERQDPAARVETVVDEFATPSERLVLDALRGAERTERLFALWARKEAALKAVGLGLGTPPSAVEAGAQAAARSHRVDVEGAPVLVSDLRRGLPGYAAAVALVSRLPARAP
jgi:4'-phosphopantetheinyl transferase